MYFLFTSSSYSFAPTKQKALIFLLQELEARNAKAQKIAVCRNPAINENSSFDFGHTSLLDTDTELKGLVYINLDTNEVFKPDSFINLS